MHGDTYLIWGQRATRRLSLRAGLMLALLCMLWRSWHYDLLRFEMESLLKQCICCNIHFIIWSAGLFSLISFWEICESCIKCERRWRVDANMSRFFLKNKTHFCPLRRGALRSHYLSHTHTSLLQTHFVKTLFIIAAVIQRRDWGMMICTCRPTVGYPL